MEQFVPEKMCRRIGGMAGEYGWGETPQGTGHPLGVEILSVGPSFQEIDHRWISSETRKKPFGRHDPFPPDLFRGERKTMQQFC